MEDPFLQTQSQLANLFSIGKKEKVEFKSFSNMSLIPCCTGFQYLSFLAPSGIVTK